MIIKFNRKEVLETVFIVISLVFLTKGLDAILPKPATTFLRYGIILVASGVLLAHADRALYIICRGWWITIITALSFFSFIWSDFPDFTIARLRSEMLPISLIGLYLATRFTPKRQIQLLGYALIVIILLSVGVAILLPSVAIGADGIFRGIYSSKNISSSYGVLSALTCFSLAQGKEDKDKTWLMGFAFSVAFVLITTSKTGLVTVFLIPLIAYLYSKLRFRGNYALAALYWIGIAVGIIAILIVDNWVFLVESIGGDPTLTGRTVIWEFLLGKVSERPWLGYGRATFWAPETNNTILVAQQLSYYGALLGLEITHAHNGFIDLLLDVGWIGFSIFWLSFIQASRKLIRQASLTVSIEAIWAVGFLILFVLNNTTESWLFRNVNLFWVMYISLCFSLESNRRFFS